jgi:hypothetical protein
VDNIDVYYINGLFIPRTEGLALAGRINAINGSNLPSRVKQMRVRPLRQQLLVYYEKKFGKYQANP